MNMPWYMMFAIGCVPLFFCYVTMPWFRAAVKRRLLFKPRDYDSVQEILDTGIPPEISIECLQASYRSNMPVKYAQHIDFYPHKEGIVCCRMKYDEQFPIARIFNGVLVANIGLLALPSKKMPRITINYSTYQVTDFDSDNEYLHIYLQHKEGKHE
ncbi:hypothetical protein pEaSNUABM25_00270 [Erwinia phage pEa_SNUABM_25]|nr:hypothetical protein pEaSNUABM25_00270 [Erwinia phage pEa_SNUABM_25]